MRKDSQQHAVVASGQVKRKIASCYLAVCYSFTLVLSSLFSTKTPSTHIHLNNFVDKSPVE